MLRNEFINKLSALLKELPPYERDKAIAYYSELIADRVEAGETEEDIIAQFGDISELAKSILAESPRLVTVTKNSSLKPLWITLLVLFSPAIFGLGIAAIGIGIAGAAALFVASLAFFIAALALALTFVFGFFSAFTIFPISPTLAIVQIGASLICGGLAIFIFIGAYAFSKLIFKIMKSSTTGIGNLINKKPSNNNQSQQTS